jgi:DNA repair protein SbcC/Rad50
MIKSVYIQNFQSHKRTKLQFDKGVNVIIGSSDGGKSAIIRAINWVITNRPSGDSIRTNGCKKDTIVKIETMEGDLIVRQKGKVNLYKLNDTVFNAFGTDVPEEIKKALNISTVNLKKQIDAPYLLSNSSGEVASHFNKIARLDVIDKSLQNVNAWERETKSEIKNIEKSISEKDERLANMKDLDKVEVKVEALESIEKHISVLGKSIKKLRDTITEIERINVEVDQISKILEIEPLANNLLTLFKKQKTLDSDITNLTNLVNKINRIKSKIKAKKLKIKLTPKIDTVLQIIANERLISADYTALNTLVYKLHTNNKNLLKTAKNMQRLTKLFKKEMGEVCILCGSKLK